MDAAHRRIFSLLERPHVHSYLYNLPHLFADEENFYWPFIQETSWETDSGAAISDV